MTCPKSLKTNLLGVAIYTCYVFLMAQVVFASSTSNFTQTITAGTLTIDIVNGSYVTVASPSVAFGSVAFSFACRTAGNRTAGTFGTASEVIYVQNPDAADGGWAASLAGSSVAAIWDSAGTDYDFNDATGSGCTDGADTPDTVGGQMTVDASVGTIAAGACAACTTTSITKGSSTAFVSGTTDSVTLLTAAAGSDDIGDWKLTGVSILNTVPAEQPAASDYDINMTLSVI